MSDHTARHSRWVDFHCHLDLYQDHAALISECDREGVATLAVTTTPKAWARNRDMAASSRNVRVALGLHPQLVAERETELPLFHHLLSETRYVGEVGLDAGPKYFQSIEAQQRVFLSILRACAEQGGKILTVHSVRATSKVLGYIEHLLPNERGSVVLHWFSGSASEARRATDLGYYFSINSEMLRSPNHCALVSKLPINRLLTETDGPFVAVAGRPARPRDVVHTVEKLAVVMNLSAEMMASQIITNLETLESK